MADESQPDCLENPKPEQLTMPTPLRPLLAAILVSLVFSSPSPVDVKLPNLFSDHMLLQQSTAAPIWGWAEPGEAVRVAATWGKDARTHTPARARAHVRTHARAPFDNLFLARQMGSSIGSCYSLAGDQWGIPKKAAINDSVYTDLGIVSYNCPRTTLS